MVHIIGSTKVTAIKILKDAKDANAAKTLICPTFEISIGVV